MHDLNALAQRLDTIEASLKQAEADRDAYHRLYLQTLERCEKLERGLVGRKAERLIQNENQLSLSMVELMLSERQKAEIDALQTEVVKEHTRKKPTGRKPIPEHLPRVDIEIVPEEVKREGLDAFTRIGEDVTEVIERRPASRA